MASSDSDVHERFEALSARLTDDRVARLRSVVRRRMRGLTVMLEGLYDAGNRSAVYRTAEAFGLLDVHVVRPEAAQKAHARQVSRGAEKWLRIHHWESPEAAVSRLRADGFRVLLADVAAARPLETVDFSRPTALAFGNEREGASDELRGLCDGSFVVPMVGFAGSLNVSVAAAIALSHARPGRERALGAVSDLSEAERDDLLLHYATLSSRWIRRVKDPTLCAD